MTTLLPYRSPRGPILLAATYRDQAAIELCWARGAGEWTPFALLRLPRKPRAAADELVAFDPVVHTLPGLENYEWVRRLREPSYREARRSRAAGRRRLAARS